jgi:hypothetical protein
MRKILTSVAVAMALSFAAANAPAKAQGSPIPFDSAYAQPGNLVDGLDIGTQTGDFESANAQQLANTVGGFAAGPAASSAYVGPLESVPRRGR